MEPTTSTLPESIMASARRWVVRLSDVHTAHERSEFENWLRQHPSHGVAYRSALQVWDAVAELKHLADHEDCTLPAPWYSRALSSLREGDEHEPASLRWSRAGLVAAMSLAGVLALSLLFHPDAAAPAGPRHATTIGQVRDVHLPDGSIVTLGAHSAIETRFTATERRLILLEGEAVFEVAHDTQKPFIVVADDILVRAVGTRFDVHRGTEQVRVTVMEGAVDVVEDRVTNLIPGVLAKRAKRVHGGEQITTHASAELDGVQPASVADYPAWHEGILRYQDASLADVVADANRYYRGQIVLSNPEIRALRVTASFGTTQIEQFVESLPGVLPVRIDHSSPGRIVVLPAGEHAAD